MSVSVISVMKMHFLELLAQSKYCYLYTIVVRLWCLEVRDEGTVLLSRLRS